MLLRNRNMLAHKSSMDRTRRSLLFVLVVAALALTDLVVAQHHVGSDSNSGLSRRRHHRLAEKRAQTFSVERIKLDSNAPEQNIKKEGIYYTSAYDDDSLMGYTHSTFDFKKGTDGADVSLDTSNAHQIIDGYGAALTDASAMLLSNLKSKNPSAYKDVMKVLFNPISGQRIIRVPMGSCDFSMKLWTYRNTKNDKFELGPAEDHQIPVLKDAVKLNPRLKIMLSPWSPPKWMKTIDNLAGGELNMDHLDDLADYYASAAQAFKKAGVTPSHMTLQNEPDYWGEYPSMRMDSPTQAKVSAVLRDALDKKSLEHIKIIAHDNNYKGWGDALNILKKDKEHQNVDGIGFHCYRGDISQISDFAKEAKQNDLDPEIHVTECSANEADQTRWNAMQWWLSTMFFPAAKQNSRSVILWNIALDSSYGPHLSTAYCKDCTGSLTIDQSGKNSKYRGQALIISHFSAATTDLHSYGGGYSRRISTTLHSHQDCIKAVQGFAAPMDGIHLAESSQKRIGLVLQNDCGSAVNNFKIAVDGRSVSRNIKPGLTTIVFPFGKKPTTKPAGESASDTAKAVSATGLLSLL